VEQYLQEGRLRFSAKYIRDFLRKGGYGDSISFEGEASDLEERVKAHLITEFAENAGREPCMEMAPPHTPNDAFVTVTPQVSTAPA
jgi:hypothetical protein